MKKLLLLLVSLALQGCTPSSIKGQVKNSPETFTGEVTGDLSLTGYLESAGSLKLVSSKGAICEGNFDYQLYHDRRGIFNCTDGRSGPFEFTASGHAWVGYGKLGNEQLTFTFVDE